MRGGRREGAGRPPSPSPRVSRTFRLDPEAARRLDRMAADLEIPASRYLDALLLGEDAR